MSTLRRIFHLILQEHKEQKLKKKKSYWEFCFWGFPALPAFWFRLLVSFQEILHYLILGPNLHHWSLLTFPKHLLSWIQEDGCFPGSELGCWLSCIQNYVDCHSLLQEGLLSDPISHRRHTQLKGCKQMVLVFPWCPSGVRQVQAGEEKEAVVFSFPCFPTLCLGICRSQPCCFIRC